MEMTDQEFDLLDELYFVTTFDQLLDKIDWEKAVLVEVLKSLIAKDWVKAVSLQDGDLPPAHIDLNKDPRAYHYLASKAGLLAHNGH